MVTELKLILWITIYYLSGHTERCMLWLTIVGISRQQPWQAVPCTAECKSNHQMQGKHGPVSSVLCVPREHLYETDTHNLRHPGWWFHRQLSRLSSSYNLRLTMMTRAGIRVTIIIRKDCSSAKPFTSSAISVNVLQQNHLHLQQSVSVETNIV